MQRIGRSPKTAISPSNLRNALGLNWTELQQGQARRDQSMRGSQSGQVMVATFIRNFLPVTR